MQQKLRKKGSKNAPVCIFPGFLVPFAMKIVGIAGCEPVEIVFSPPVPLKTGSQQGL